MRPTATRASQTHIRELQLLHRLKRVGVVLNTLTHRQGARLSSNASVTLASQDPTEANARGVCLDRIRSTPGVDHVYCARRALIPQRQVQARRIRAHLAQCALLQSRAQAVRRANATLVSPGLTLGHANLAHLARTRARKARRLATTFARNTRTPPWPAL